MEKAQSGGARYDAGNFASWYAGIVALNYHIVPDKANIIYQSIGVQFGERIIDPAIQEVVKAVTAKYTAEELITKKTSS